MAGATTVEKQPRGLYLLFGVEMWERFSYYGMKAILVLFLVSTVGGWGWTKEQAADVYKWYTGLVYLTPLLGGYLADRFLGTHKAIVIGSVVIAAGHFLLAAPGHTTFFAGLALIVIGTGFHKSNISTMVGQLFRPADGRRDGAFTIFYVGINVGATIGPIICGWLEKDRRFGWHWAFAAAGVGMVLGTVTYLVFKRSWLGDVGDRPAGRPAVDRHAHAEPITGEQREGILAIVLLAVFNLFFWAAYEQTGSSMTFFAEEHTRRLFLGFEIPAPWFQSINPVIIITCAPLFARLWTWLAARRREPSTPIKFVIGLVLLGLGFVLMVMAGRLADGGVAVSPLWLTFAYVLHTSGEICLYPVSLSMVTKLAPAKYGSLLMGFWFFSMAFSDFLAGHIASLAEKIEKGQYFRILGGQADFYLVFVISSFAAALVLLVATPVLKRLMHGRA